jgi:hypothetical protein
MFLAYARALGYNETPDYNYVQNLFSSDTLTPGYTRPDIGEAAEAESSDASSGGLGNQSVPRGL